MNNILDQSISKAISLVSHNDIYQRKLFTFLCIMWTQIAMNALINPMVFTNPLFKCRQQQATQLTIASQAYACSNMDKCIYQNSFTATFSAGLYCNHRDARMTLQSLFAIGSILGTLVIPIQSDVRGRKFAISISMLFMLLGNISILFGIIFASYFMIGIGQLFSAAGSVAAAVVSYSINSDFFSDELRQKAIIYYCAAWGLTDMSILFVWYFIPYWIFFLLALLLIPISVLFIYFKSFFLESVNYLVAKNRFNEAKQIIKKLTELNFASDEDSKKSLQIIQYIQNTKSTQLDFQKRQKQQTESSIKTVIKNKKYLKAVVCLIFIKMGYYSFYFGAQGCLERTGFNFGISIFLLGFGEFTGYLTGTKFVPLFKRKQILIATNLATALIGILYVTNLVQNSPFLASLILYVSFVLNSYNFSAISLLQTQSFSSSIRSTAVGMVFGTSYLVRLVVPFAIGFFNERGIHPIIACSMLIVLMGMAPSFIIDETFKYSHLNEKLFNNQQNISLQQISKIKKTEQLQIF